MIHGVEAPSDKPQPTVTTLAIPVDDQDHALGPVGAAVTLVEYGDYECPYCARSHPVVKRLVAHFRDGLRFVFRHFPLNNVHPHAATAALAAEAAGAQGKFWAMHDVLFAHQDDLAAHDMDWFAMRAGLEPYRFNADVSSERYAKRLRDHIAGGTRSGVTGTPTFFINGQRYAGPRDQFEPLREAIDEAGRDRGIESSGDRGIGGIEPSGHRGIE